MILILSRDRNEMSTDEVIDWINALGGSCQRLNGEDLEGESSYMVEINEASYSFNFYGNALKFSSVDVKVVWYRRWYKGEMLNVFSQLDSLLFHKIRYHLNNELLHTGHAIFRMLANARWLDHPKYTQLNKLSVILKAREVGLLIPHTIITNDREIAKEFILKNASITKSISDIPSYVVNEVAFVGYTAEVNLESLNNVSRFFYPSLFQEKLEKKYELRVFYLDGDFFSMAIFSQENNKTSIDFRRYDFEKPNRFVPYRLPKEIEHRLTLLMNDLNLKSGSIDLIRTIDGEYYFLEVNPVGQFGMVSKPCNYKLEKRIAKFLVDNDR